MSNGKVKVPVEQRRRFVLMYTLFFALFIGNVTNYIGLLWISDNGTIGRQMINYLLGPLLLMFFSDDIFSEIKSEKVYVKSKKWNNMWILIIIFIAFIFCNLNIKFEEEKNVCLKEQTKENLIQCIKEKEQFGNRMNLSKLY